MKITTTQSGMKILIALLLLAMLGLGTQNYRLTERLNRIEADTGAKIAKMHERNVKIFEYFEKITPRFNTAFSKLTDRVEEMEGRYVPNNKTEELQEALDRLESRIDGGLNFRGSIEEIKADIDLQDSRLHKLEIQNLRR